MPFTPTHILAVVPLAAVRHWGLPLSGLAIGSMVPDLPLFLPGASNYQVTHSAPGLITADLPLGLAGFLAFQFLFKRFLIALMPTWARRRSAGLARPCVEPTIQLAFRVGLAVVLGAFTHLAWDSFTHRDRTASRFLPALNAAAFDLGGRPVPTFKALQYGSSAIGLPVLAALALGWLRRQPAGPLDGLPDLPRRARAAALLVAAAIPAAAGAVVATRADLTAYRKLAWFVTRAGCAELVALTAASLAFRA